MKNILQTTRFLFLYSAITILVFIPHSTPGQQPVHLKGSLQTDNRMRLDEGTLTWNENRLNLELSGGDLTEYSFFSKIWLRGFGFPRASGLADLQRRDKAQVMQWGLEFREAFLDLYAFGLSNLDLRVGRQIINWGTGDGFNPTGNVSPDDLEDLLFFGTHLGVNALKATYYAPAFRMTGVFIPVFTPATLPAGDYSEALFASDISNFDTKGFEYRTNLSLPKNTLSASSQFAFKIASMVFNYDASLSYYNGRYDLPVITGMNASTDPPVVNTTFRYPGLQVIGGDFAGSVGPVGIWGEIASFYPEKVTARIAMPSPLPPYETVTRDSTVLSGSSYVQYLLGIDYTFRNRWYINLQFLHGFLHEQGSEQLNDYLIFRTEREYFHGNLTVSPIAFALSITDWNAPQKTFGVIGIPEFTYRPADNVSIRLGSFLFGGTGPNIFHALQDLDQLYLRITVSF